jgi:pimeloyl-ACP methyl ester carboxylesterase
MSSEQPSSIVGRRFAVSRFLIVLFLLLVMCPSALRAQCADASCCYLKAIFACIFQDLCSIDEVYTPCINGLPAAPPPSPPSPPPPSGPPSACGAEPAIAYGPTQAASSRQCVITFLDPVTALQTPDGKGITSNTAKLGSAGTQIQAVAADSASQVVVQIGWNRAEAVRVTLLNDGDNNPDSPTPRTTQEVGSLSTLGGSEQQLQLTVNASGNPPMAFVIFRPPQDFVRYFNAAGSITDPPLGFRNVTFYADNEAVENDFRLPTSLHILRPPVVLVHGLWDSQDAWSSFPLLKDQRFSTQRANYYIPVAVSSANAGVSNGQSLPWPASSLAKANANQLSFTYNAPRVLQQIQKIIIDFRAGQNVLGVPAAAAQVDVVAHSMGGLVTRQITTLPAYLQPQSFEIGNIHKLITIGTPHFGSIVPTLLLQDPCLEMLLAKSGMLAFGSQVQLNDPSQPQTHGAIYDMQGDANGDAGGASDALTSLNGTNPHAAPVAEIAAAYIVPSKSSLAQDFLNLLPLAATTIWYGLGCNNGNGPLEQNLSVGSWGNIFNNQPNDGMVSVLGQGAGQKAGETTGGQAGFAIQETPSILHSAQLRSMGFQGPAELEDQNTIPPDVVNLLNKPVDSSWGFFKPF